MDEFIKYGKSKMHKIPVGNFIEKLYVRNKQNLRNVLIVSDSVGFQCNDTYLTIDIGTSSLLAKYVFGQEIIYENNYYYHPCTLILEMNEIIRLQELNISSYKTMYIKHTSIQPQYFALQSGRGKTYGIGHFFKMHCFYDDDIQYAYLANVRVGKELYDNYKIIYSMYSKHSYYVLIETFDEIDVFNIMLCIEDAGNTKPYNQTMRIML